MVKQSSFMLAWTKAMLSTYGPPKSTTRHVLLTLATHMNGNGTSCYPSQKTLAAEMRMSHVAIYKHLEIAAQLGWIARWLQKEGGRDWALTHYEATFPESVPAEEFDPPWLLDQDWQRSEGAKRRYPPVVHLAREDARQRTSNFAKHVEQGTKPHAPRQETKDDQARDDDREAGNHVNGGTKRRFNEGSIQGFKEVSIQGLHTEGAGASARTGAPTDGEKERPARIAAPLGRVLTAEVKGAPLSDSSESGGKESAYAERHRIMRLTSVQTDLLDADVAKICHASVELVREVRGSMGVQR